MTSVFIRDFEDDRCDGGLVALQPHLAFSRRACPCCANPDSSAVCFHVLSPPPRVAQDSETSALCGVLRTPSGRDCDVNARVCHPLSIRGRSQLATLPAARPSDSDRAPCGSAPN